MIDLAKYPPQWVKISDINLENKMFQFRRDITPESVAELAASLKADGQKFPIVVWRRNNPPSHEASDGRGGELVIVCGWRRVNAAISNKSELILAIVIPESEQGFDEMLRHNFIENIARKTLTNPDIIFACKKLKDQGMTNEAIGKAIGGKSEKMVRLYLKVAVAPQETQKGIIEGSVPVRDIGKAEAGIGTRSDSAEKNKNCYVKSMNNGFDAVLRYRFNKDTPAVADGFMANIRKAVAKAATSAQRPATGNDKGKGGVGGGFSRRDESPAKTGGDQGEKERGLKPAATKPEDNGKIASPPGADRNDGFAGDKKEVGAGFSPGNVVADLSASLKAGLADSSTPVTPSPLMGEGRDEGGNTAKNKTPSPQSSPKAVGEEAVKAWHTVVPGNASTPGGSIKDLIMDRQKGMLAQIKQLAQNPMTKPIAEQMAKANGCQTVEEFIGKLEKQLEALKKQ